MDAPFQRKEVIGNCTLYLGNSLDVLPLLSGIHACVTDPPYELGFMGKGWDASGIANNKELWRKALAGLLPGAHLLAFSGSRTYHRMTCAIEDAGFEIRDQIMWLYSSGFPKSMNLKNVLCSCNTDVELSRIANSETGLEQGKAQAQHDLRSVCEADLSPSLNPACESGQVLQPGPPQQGTSINEVELPGNARGSQPGMERWSDAIQKEGQLHGSDLCPRAGMGAADGEEGRLHHAAPTRNGSDVRKASDAPGGGEPQGSQAEQQCSTEFGDVPLQRQPQESRVGEMCDRCGKPMAAALLGWGTALKPAHEPICVARKPLIGTVAANVSAHGVGGLNIDGCRVPTDRAPRH